MNVLFIVSRPLEINTSASIRNLATINGLVELGHKVDLITTEYDKNHPSYDSSMVLNDEDINVKYLKLSGLQNIAKIGRKYKSLKLIKKIGYKILNKIEIYDNLKGIINCVSEINIDDNKYDIVISSSDPKSSHLFVLKMYENNILNKTPWIQIWGDPFFSDISRKNKLLSSRIKQEEEKLIKYAKRVVYVSKLTLNYQQNKYSKYAGKMLYIPIPFVKKEYYPEKEIKNSGQTLTYCGEYPKEIRDILPLYNGINKSKHKLIICGNSDIQLEDTPNVKINGRVNFKKVKEIEANSDVLIHLSNLRGTQIPGKIYQYSGTNKPILFILDGDSEDLRETFMKYNRYIFCENNEQSILNALEKIQELNNLVKNEPIEDFSGHKIASEIIKDVITR